MVATPVPPIAAAIIRARKHVIRHLVETGATAASSAVTYQPQRRMHRKALAYLQGKGIVSLTQDGRHWVDETKADAWRKKLRNRMAIMIGGALAAVGAVFAMTR